MRCKIFESNEQNVIPAVNIAQQVNIINVTQNADAV